MDPEENLNGFCEQEEEEDVHAVELKALGVATCVASPAGCCGCLFTVIAVMVGFAVYIVFFPVCLSFNFTDFKVINSEISNDYYQKLLAEDTKFSTLGSESNSRRRLIFEEQDIFGIEERRIRRRLQTELYGYNLWTSKDFYYRAIAAIYLNVFYYSKETNNILTEELLNICHAVEQGIKSFNGYHNHSLIYKETDTKIELLFPGISPLYLESAPGSFLNYIYPQIILGNYVFNGNGDVLTLEGNDIEETIRTYKDVGDLTEFFDFSFDFINVSSKYLAAIYPFGYKNENETKDELYNWVSTYKIGFFDKLGSSVTNKIGIAFADSRGVILENELYYYLAQDLNLAIWSLLLIYIVVYLYCRSFYITSLGLLGVCSSFIPCFAIYHMIWGESFNLVNMVALWVILGIGADDIFVFMSSYRRAPLESVNGTIIPNHLRLAFAYREAGSAMFVTSFTTACSFFSLCLSTINPLPQFGWFLGSLVLCNFVLVMSYFPCILQSYVWFVMACMKFKCHLKCCNKWLSVAVPRPDQYDPKQLDKQQSVKVLKRSSNIAIPAAVNNNTPHTPQSLQKRPSYNRQSSNKFIIPGADYIDEQNNSNIDEQNNSKHSAQSSAPAQLMRQLTRKLDAGGGFSAETHFSDCTNLYFVIMRRGLGVTLIVIVLILTSIFAYTATLITLPQETAKLLPENTNWGAVTTAISKMDIDESQFSGYSTSSGESTGQIIAVTTSKPSIPPTQPRPTYAPTQPSIQPIPSPTPLPTTPIPTPSPTSNTNNPTYLPSKFPSIQPSKNPTPSPVNNPTISPTTINPTITPSINPSISPTTITIEPTINPSSSPTKSPSAPTNTFTPSISPSITTIQPTLSPSIITSQPTSSPSYIPSISPSKNPSITPTITTIIPSITPTKSPSTISPTDTPSITPSITPTNNPSYIPSIAPSTYPSISPTVTTITPSITPTTTPTKSPTFAGCGSSLLLDLIFILDSSGSVYDSEYINWQSELDFAKAIVNSSLPTDSKIGCINFSGCGSSTSFEDCKKNNKLKKMWGLTDYGIPNDKLLVYDRFASMGPSDFNQGWTWTDEALQIALNEFRGNSSIDRSRMIIILTDGYPQPEDLPNKIQHEPCIVNYPKVGETYISPTLQALRDEKVLIIAIGIQMAQDKLDKYIKCLVEDIDNYFFAADDFGALASLATVISDIVCSGETYSPSSTPTTFPSNPTALSSIHPSSSPTPSPTNSDIHVYVSKTGVDLNYCNRTSPCLTINYTYNCFLGNNGCDTQKYNGNGMID
eukprot:469243_1